MQRVGQIVWRAFADGGSGEGGGATRAAFARAPLRGKADGLASVSHLIITSVPLVGCFVSCDDYFDYQRVRAKGDGLVGVASPR